MVTFRDELDTASQDRPVGLFPRCHPEGALSLVYNEGVATACCAQCGAIVDHLAVALRPACEGNGQSKATACSCDGRQAIEQA